MSNTQIAVSDSQIIANINGWGDGRVAPLYQGRNFDTWKQDAILAVMENDDLRNCMATETGKISIVRSLQRSATSGLSLNPQKGESALVAINGKVNFWLMKNGIAKKALETGALEYVQSDTVFEGDTFILKKTALGDNYDFSPSLENRGNAKGFFASAVLKNGRCVVEYWTLAQAEEHKKKHGKGLTNPKSAWNINTNAMHEKGVLKALLTGLHLPEVTQIIETFNRVEEDEPRDVTESQEKGSSAENLAADLSNLETQPNEGNVAKAEQELDIF